MEELIEKYHQGFKCDQSISRGSAISAFIALKSGNTHDGDLFLMHSDSFMKEHLLSEDYAYWIQQKHKWMQSIAE